MRRTSRPRNSRSGGRTLKKVGALIAMLVGFLLAAPFCYDVFSRTAPSHGTSLYDIVTFTMMMIGGPTFMYGLSSLLARNFGGSPSQSEMDIARIRHVVESDRWNRK